MSRGPSRLNLFTALWQDFRYSLRALRRSPGFAIISIASLALGIGATAAIFSVFDVAVLHPLPVAGAERLVWFREYGKDLSESGGNPPRFHDWQRARSFETLTGFYGESAVLNGQGSPVRLEGLHYIGALPGVLAARLQAGRFPSPDEVDSGASVLVLSDHAWRTLLHRDPAILGRAIDLSGKRWQVVGILDPGVRYPDNIDFWSPASREVQQTGRQAGFLAQAGRLRDGITLSAAQSEIDALASRFGREYAATDAGRSLHLQTLADHISETSRQSLGLFLAAAAAVLLIASVNVAGLILARGLRRQREASIRVALGAGQSGLVRLFLIEAVLLALGGCVAGIPLAALGLNVLKAALPEDTPRLAQASIDLRVLCFAALLLAFSALVCGLLPAWKAAHYAIAVGLKQDAPGSLGGHTRLRSALVAGQIALSLVLLVAGGLLLSSFAHLRQAPLGFEPAHAYSFSVLYSWDTPPKFIDTKVRQVLDQLATAPGVQAAGVVDRLPLHGGSQTRPVVIQNATLAPEKEERQIGWRMASSSFFPAAGIPLLSGKLYSDAASRECLVTRQLAASLFGNRSPIGQNIASRPRNGAAPEWFRIVGLIGDTRLRPSDTSGAAEVYVPWGADYWPVLNFIVRTRLSLSDLRTFVRHDVEPLLAGQVVEQLATLDDLTAETRSAPRTRAIVAALLAGVALSLSTLGLWGLLAYEAARRTREYGVRAVLGADPLKLASEAVRRALRLAALGMVVGLVAAFFFGRLLESLLFEVKASDPAIYLGACLLLVSVALLASAGPALRASRADPNVALRHE